MQVNQADAQALAQYVLEQARDLMRRMIASGMAPEKAAERAADCYSLQPSELTAGGAA
jgi:hypothetical protein